MASGRKKRLFWYSVALTILFNGWFFAWLLLQPGTAAQFTAIDNLAQSLGYLLGAVFCLIGIDISVRSRRNSTTTTRRAWPWVPCLFFVSLLLSGIAQGIWLYYQQVLQQAPPTPSWADAFFLSAYPFQLLAILLLPTRPLSGIARSRVLLDGLIMLTALITLSWYFILGPTILQGQGTLLAKAVGASYPFLDLVTVLCLILLLSRAMNPVLRSGFFLLMCALIIVVIIDTVYDYQTLQNIYVTGNLLDLGWSIGDMLIGLAVLLMNIAHSWQKSPDEATTGTQHFRQAAITLPSTWITLLLYLFIPAVLVLTVWIWRIGQNDILTQGVYIGAVALIGLVILRQVFAIQQTKFNNLALGKANNLLEQQAAQIQVAYEQQCQLNDLKDQFILNVNHELRTPLTEIWGYLHLLLDYHGQIDTSMQNTFITNALHGCDDLLSLVNTILDAARVSSSEQPAPVLSKVHVMTAVREALAIFGPQKQQGHIIELDIPDSLFVKTDKNFLHRVLVNLVSNALKYSPEQTKVVISATQIFPQSQYANSCPEVRLSVQDAGPGISRTDIPLLFGKFVRLNRDLGGSIRGTGLGLYLCKQLVEAMDGRIWVESAGISGQGSRFNISLPASTHSLATYLPQRLDDQTFERSHSPEMPRSQTVLTQS